MPSSKAQPLDFPLTLQPTTRSRWIKRLASSTAVISQLFVCLIAVAWYNGVVVLNLAANETARPTTTTTKGPPYECHPPFPPIPLSEARLSTLGFKLAAAALDKALEARSAAPDIDSLSVALVTPSAVVFQRHYGVLRANETEPENRYKPDADSIYRIASISKMFAVLELLILRQKGVLDWDDSVNQYLSNFTFPSHSWAQYLHPPHTGRLPIQHSYDGPITLRQLASHMSGIGRDYPPVNIKGWPNSEISFNLSLPTKSQVLDSIAKLPLVAPQYTYPVYSNTGFNLLGYTITAAANKTSSYADLIEEDIFKPLNLASSFKVTLENAANVAVASVLPEEADIDLTDAYHAAGGQYSSLRDLSTVMRTFLDPSRRDSLLSPYVMREWLRPLHGWLDGLTEVGAPWEIFKLRDGNGIPRRLFTKGGNLQTHHSILAIDPSTVSGVIVLMTGRFPDASSIAVQTIQAFQSAFAREIRLVSNKLYFGRWVSDDLKSEAVTFIENGSLYIRKLVVNGTDLFAVLEGPAYPRTRRYGLWTTGREDEFRVAVGRPELNDVPLAGCEPYWMSIDPFYSRGAPVDLILFEGEGLVRLMKIPSVGATLRRRFSLP